MAQGIVVYLVLGIAIHCGIASVWSDSGSHQTASESFAQRLHEVEVMQRLQKEELRTQGHLIEKQAKQIEELTTQREKQARQIEELTIKLSETKKGDTFMKLDEKPGVSNLTSNLHKENSGIVTSTDGPGDENTATGIRTLRATSGMVAFTAYLGHDEELSGPQVVIFDKITTNEGGAYNAKSGIFTAPIDGVYMFTYFIGQRGVHQLGIDLVLNNQRMVGAVVEGNQEYQDLQGGNLVIKRLRKGDTVWARRRYGAHLEGDNYELTTFSGVLLF